MDGMNYKPDLPRPPLDTSVADRAALWVAVRMTLVMAVLVVGSVLAWAIASPASDPLDPVVPAVLPIV